MLLDTITSMQCSNDSLTSNTKDITKILNNYFQSVFTNSASLPDVPAVEKQDLVVTEEGVLVLLKSLKSGKAPGPDGLDKQKLCIAPEHVAPIFFSVHLQL